MLHYFNIALDSDVKPSELSEIVTHLAFYTGWSSALSAVPILKEIFAQRGIGADQLPEVSPHLLPLHEAGKTQRASTVETNFGAVAPNVVQYTTDLLFRDLWLCPALASRDRSLVAVGALIASGHVAQITYHLNRAMDNGLTQAQASEVLTHIAVYAGWPSVFSALPVAKEVFEKRKKEITCKEQSYTVRGTYVLKIGLSLRSKSPRTRSSECRHMRMRFRPTALSGHSEDSATHGNGTRVLRDRRKSRERGEDYQTRSICYRVVLHLRQ